MRMLKIFAIAILFVIAVPNFVQAKAACLPGFDRAGGTGKCCPKCPVVPHVTGGKCKTTGKFPHYKTKCDPVKTTYTHRHVYVDKKGTCKCKNDCSGDQSEQKGTGLCISPAKKVAVQANSTLTNLEANGMPVIFKDAAGAIVHSSLADDNIAGNGAGNYVIEIPAGAVSVTVGPDDNDTASGTAIFNLTDLVATGTTYQITVDDDGLLTITTL
jgi:hypothetical protein